MDFKTILGIDALGFKYYSNIMLHIIFYDVSPIEVIKSFLSLNMGL